MTLSSGYVANASNDNPIPMTLINTNSPNVGAFGWLRTAKPEYVFDAQMTYDDQPLQYEKVVTGTGASATFDATNRCGQLAFSSTATGGKAYYQQYEHNRYQPGRSQCCFITGNFVEHKANVLKFLKYGEGEGGNGVAFESNGTGYQITLYSTTAEGNQTVTQANWNGDKLDGTGPSGRTLNVSKGVIVVMDFQALYYGRVRVGVDIDGEVIVCHAFNNANVKALPYIANANLPISAGMTCTGTVSTTMQFTCCSVISEGGQTEIGGYPFAIEGMATAGSNALTHILSVRPKATFNSITNRTKFIFNDLSLLVTGSNPIYWEVCLGQAISGTTTFNDVNTTYSAFEYNTAGTISGSSAIVLESGYLGASAQSKGNIDIKVPMKYPLTLDKAGAVRALGTITVNVKGIGGTSACRASMSWIELR